MIKSKLLLQSTVKLKLYSVHIQFWVTTVVVKTSEQNNEIPTLPEYSFVYSVAVLEFC